MFEKNYIVILKIELFKKSIYTFKLLVKYFVLIFFINIKENE